MDALNIVQNHGIVPQDIRFCEGAGATFYFLEDPIFPLHSFSPSMHSCPFRVGSELFHKEVVKALDIQL